MTDVTCILNAIEQGDPKAADELLPLVYEELRLLAAEAMRRILVDNARRKKAVRHGGAHQKIDLDPATLISEEDMQSERHTDRSVDTVEH